MRSFGVFVSERAVVLGLFGVLFAFGVAAVVMMMRCLMMVMRGSSMMGGSQVLFARGVLVSGHDRSSDYMKSAVGTEKRSVATSGCSSTSTGFHFALSPPVFTRAKGMRTAGTMFMFLACA